MNEEIGLVEAYTIDDYSWKICREADGSFTLWRDGVSMEGPYKTKAEARYVAFDLIETRLRSEKCTLNNRINHIDRLLSVLDGDPAYLLKFSTKRG